MEQETDGPESPRPSRRPAGVASRLRRDLGTLESYAALVGILVGAGIFKVTSDAFALTGPSVVLGYLALAPAVFATSVAYVVYLSTSLGTQPGGEYTHVSRTFGDRRIAFVGAWLKMIAYLGAGAYLSVALADYLLELLALGGVALEPSQVRIPLSLGGLTFFWAVQVFGVRWWGRVQVALCAVLGVSILVLVVPGLFAIELENYRPLFTGGAGGFAAALVPLFFAFAGFESLAHSAGEVVDSRKRLPQVFVRGVLLTTVIFIAMSAVAFGVLPGERLATSAAPMADVAAVYLPRGAAALVTVGGVAAVATSLNASLYVPSRLGIVLAEDDLLPEWTGSVSVSTGVPFLGLSASYVICGTLIASGQVSLALNIAIFALVMLYGLHSSALLVLPRRNPQLYAEVETRLPRGFQVGAAWVSILSMATLVGVQVVADVRTLGTTSLSERLRGSSLTAVELAVVWSLVGLVLYRGRVARKRKKEERVRSDRRRLSGRRPHGG